MNVGQQTLLVKKKRKQSKRPPSTLQSRAENKERVRLWRLSRGIVATKRVYSQRRTKEEIKAGVPIKKRAKLTKPPKGFSIATTPQWPFKYDFT